MSEPTSASTLHDFSTALANLVANAASSVIALHADRARSSGFVWRPGLIVTADEALPEDGTVTAVLRGGKAVPTSLVGRDPTTDVALLRIEDTDLRPATLSTHATTAG